MATKKIKRSRKRILNSELVIIFGKNVKRERLQLGKTQIELAVAIKSSGTYIGLIERGQAGVTLPKLERICKELRQDVCYMLRSH